ncbi:MAG: tripartite tricarboxylate transporter substrate binding protein [Comamonadaceae bacterium]|nr:tripartite tricarboxylate transporter substrate binding protein [Comamonadaceae bacterium]
MKTLKNILASVGIAAFSFIGAVHADTYPSKPIRLIVPFAAGSGSDNSARYIAQKVTEHTGWNFVVDNKPGGGGIIGLGEVQRSPADGYTLLYTGGTTHGVNSALFKKLPYDPIKDFTSVTPGSFSPMVLLARPDLGANTAQELIELIRKSPGKYSGATGSSYQILAMEVFKQEAKLETVNVSYKGSAQSMADLLGGHVDFTLVDLSAGLPQIKAGAFKALTVTTPQRVSVLPDVPTTAEIGLPDVKLAGWAGLFVRSGTPPAVLATLRAGFNKYFQTPEYTAWLAEKGGYYKPLSEKEMEVFILEEIGRAKNALKRAGIAPQ